MGHPQGAENAGDMIMGYAGIARMHKVTFATAALFAALGAGGAAQAADSAAVIATYADIAHAGYEDSLATAMGLDAAVDALIAKPSAATLQAARAAWVAARAPYQQTEGLPLRQPDRRRLGGPGERLAARRGADRLCRRRLWRPSPTTNALYVVNVIANRRSRPSAGQAVDATDHHPGAP
jgi:putative iron-regulated protein